jgi:response regulator RpfG family c-di-GMP phosphodiesterase
MALKYQHTILLLDDETSITNALTRLFHREKYRILTAANGEEALDLMKKQDRPVSLIISDQRMPGMNGTRFLEEARNISPHTIRFLLTGYSEMDALVEAVNKGEIHRYLTKPWNDSDLLLQVRQSLEHHELYLENRRLLALTRQQNLQLKELNSQLEQRVEERTREVTLKNEKLSSMNKELESSLFNTVRAFAALVEMHAPALGNHGRRVGALCRELALFMGLDENEVTATEIAGLLHDIGKLGLPQKLLDYNSGHRSVEDQALLQKHPEEGQSIVTFIKRLDHVGLLIRSHHERVDGRGYPDHLSGEVIPLGAQIIAAADVFDRIVNMQAATRAEMSQYDKDQVFTQDPLPEEEKMQRVAIHHMQRNIFSCYDPDVVKAFLSFLNERGIRYRKDRGLSVNDLVPGMELSKPIYTGRGKFLLPHKTVLTEDLILRIKALHESDPITENIWIIEK